MFFRKNGRKAIFSYREKQDKMVKYIPCGLRSDDYEKAGRRNWAAARKTHNSLEND